MALTAAWLGARVQRGTTERTLRAQFEENERVRREQQAEADRSRESAWLQERRKLMHDEKRRAYGVFVALAGDYTVMKAQRDGLAERAQRRGRKWQDGRLKLKRNPDDYMADAYHSAEEDRRAAETLVRETKRKLELVLADLQLIAPEELTTAAEDTADLLYEGKPTEDQLTVFIRAARHDLGSD